MRKLLIFSVFLSALLLYKISFAANACFPMVHNSQLPANTPEVTVIIGTDRQGSNSAIVSKAILSQLAAQNNVRINLVDLAKLPKSIFKSDYFAKKPAEFTKNFVEPIDQASALVFVIPEYDGAVPGILSYFMNHVRVPLAEKQVALVGLSAGRWGARSALDSFKGTLTHRAARVLGDLQINIENVDAKISEQNITDPETNRRINDSAAKLAKNLNQLPNSLKMQKLLGQAALAAKGKATTVEFNNQTSVEGELGNAILTQDGQIAYLQFRGATQLKSQGEVIPGQDASVHREGYGMPVGAVKNFKKAWFKKENLEASGLTTTGTLAIGKSANLKWESGITVSGKIKNLTYDNKGNLLIVTFTDVQAKNGTQILFEKAWGDFDILIGDFVEGVN